MKRIYFLLASFLIITSCDEEEPEIYGELYNQIAGKCERVSETHKYYEDNILRFDRVKYDFPFITQEDDTVYLTYLNFLYIGTVVSESNDGTRPLGGLYKWGVQDNKFWVLLHELGENQCEIHELTDTKFHFTHTYKGRIAYGSINTTEITTYKLRR